MGVTTDGISFLAAASRSGVDYQRTLMIGRQAMVSEGRRVRAGLREAGLEIDLETARAISRDGQGFCEPLLRHLGAEDIQSLDASDFEGSTIVHDLNKPLPAPHLAAYSVVIDGGTLEHVFDFPAALKTCLEGVALGGHYIAITPVNNYAGHGFYQLTPELYFRVLAPDNGFRVRCMLWRSDHPFAGWYQVADPANVGHRVERRGLSRTLLFLAAERFAHREILAIPPQQSDYAAEWAAGAVDHGSREALSSLAGRVARRVPLIIKDGLQFAQQIRTYRGSAKDFTRVPLKQLPFA